VGDDDDEVDGEDEGEDVAGDDADLVGAALEGGANADASSVAAEEKGGTAADVRTSHGVAAGGEEGAVAPATTTAATNGGSGRPRSSSSSSSSGGLIALPAGFSVGADGSVVLRASSSPTGRADDRPSSAAASAAAGGYADGKGGGGAAAGSRKKKRRGASKTTTPPTDGVDVATAKISTSDAIRKLGATEVSIGEATRVQVKQPEAADQSASDDAAGSTPDAKVTGAEAAKGARRSSKHLRADPARRGGDGVTGSDDASMLRAARHFNKMVRVCVERSDPDGMRKILRDKHNHRFALDSHVLETVLKAYVMAAMFEDALYCCRNCALPGTLSAIQAERILQCLPQNLRNSSAYTAADMINALCIATHFDQPTSRTYFMRIVRGIALEFLEEATSARDRICSAPCERLVRSAYCVVDARLRRGKKPSDLVVDPGRQLGVFIPDTTENRGMQAGDAVSILPYAGPYPMSAESLDRNMIEATVANAAPLVLRLQDKGNMELYRLLTDNVEGNVYRIDKLANRMGFTRQLAAAVSVVSPPEHDEDGYPVADRRHPSAELIKAITAMDENIDRVMMAGGNFHPPTNGRGGRMHEQTSIAAICSRAVPWSAFDRGCDYDDDSGQESMRSESLLALEKYGALEGLNESQRLAVQGAATNRLTLVQGPPGTGKTAVAIRILQHWARVAQARVRPGCDPSPILATSDSNIAVDNLVEGCANVGLRVVRLGRPEAIRPELLQYCIDRSPADSKGGGGIPASMMKEKMKILKNAQVVCCTCIGSGGDILDSMTFERVMVDEATQATEPAVLVPIARGCRQLVLVGDHCQLPPTVLSTRAEEEGLGVPLFSRMVACGVPPFMLDTQYRMHPGISMFPSDLFYGGKLKDGVSPPERRPLQGFPWPREEFPVAFIPIIDSVEIDDGVSKANEAEALEVCHAVVQLLDGGQCTVSDIAVVTPYAAQVRLIRRQLRNLLPQGPPFVEVSSTDGFQGREKEAVIFSAVRSNSYGAVGFVSDWRRINVSFTRARRALIVVGNPDTLRRGDPDTFGAWLQWADAHGVNMMSPGKPRGRYEPEVLRKVRGGTTAAEMLKDVLDRQQAQLKTAEQQQARAVVNAAGHIMGKEADNMGNAATNGSSLTLKDDLAMLENSDGCWDDSDDDIVGTNNHTTYRSANDTNSGISENESDEPLDAWDL
jgi:regulator of nonsense transcripts 1